MRIHSFDSIPLLVYLDFFLIPFSVSYFLLSFPSYLYSYRSKPLYLYFLKASNYLICKCSLMLLFLSLFAIFFLILPSQSYFVYLYIYLFIYSGIFRLPMKIVFIALNSLHVISVGSLILPLLVNIPVPKYLSTGPSS